jgi:Kef-type K+ transport system membrane component KefB
MNATHFLGLLVIMLASAKLLGTLAQRIGQPAVLGELLAGVIVGPSVLGLVDPKNEVLHLLAEMGVVFLLFEIGLETDLHKLLQVGGTSGLVALVGVVLPFALGYAVCRLLSLDNIVAVVVGAALTATSVGITARVLADLGRLQEPESQIVLGAAVLDDLIGLVILAVVKGVARGEAVTLLGVASNTAVSLGFVVVTLLLGRLVVPHLFRLAGRLLLANGTTLLAVLLAFGLAWLADRAGSAAIIGAFAAGLLLAGMPESKVVEQGVTHLGHFFVPLFFLAVGAAVDVRVFNPLEPANYRTLLVGGLLIVAAVVGKFLAGYAPFWFRGRKSVIGVGMIPRGEVGLIFAQAGLISGVFDRGLFSAVALMVLVTTFLAPPLLKLLFPSERPEQPPQLPGGTSELVTEA